MTANFYPTYPYGESGYTCGSCGSFVVYGHWHSCTSRSTNFDWKWVTEEPKELNEWILEAAMDVKRVVEENEN